MLISLIMIGDDAFPLGEQMLKPYPRNSPTLTTRQKVYNYRISRARRTVENSFGLLVKQNKNLFKHSACYMSLIFLQVSKFRILRGPIQLNSNNAVNAIKSCVVLHNFLIKESRSSYIQGGDLSVEGSNHEIIPGEWEKDSDLSSFLRIDSLGSNLSENSAARKLRDSVAQYFLTEKGELDWQYQYAYVNKSA